MHVKYHGCSLYEICAIAAANEIVFLSLKLINNHRLVVFDAKNQQFIRKSLDKLSNKATTVLNGDTVFQFVIICMINVRNKIPSYRCAYQENGRSRSRSSSTLLSAVTFWFKKNGLFPDIGVLNNKYNRLLTRLSVICFQ